MRAVFDLLQEETMSDKHFTLFLISIALFIIGVGILNFIIRKKP